MPHVAWTELEAAARQDAQSRIQDQFAADPDRLSRMTLDAAGLHLDLSKQSWSRAGFEAALALARRGRLVESRRRAVERLMVLLLVLWIVLCALGLAFIAGANRRRLPWE